MVGLRRIAILQEGLTEHRAITMDATTTAVLDEPESKEYGITHTICKYGKGILTSEMEKEVTYNSIEKGLKRWVESHKQKLDETTMTAQQKEKIIQEKKETTKAILENYKTKSPALNLSNRELSSLPPGIEELIHLKELNISQNKLSQLPSSFKALKNLEKLDCSHNELKTLPEELKQLSKLETIDISDNWLEKIPACILQLEKLDKLNLLENRFEKRHDGRSHSVSLREIPAEFFQIKFKELHLDPLFKAKWVEVHQAAIDCLK